MTEATELVQALEQERFSPDFNWFTGRYTKEPSDTEGQQLDRRTALAQS